MKVQKKQLKREISEETGITSVKIIEKLSYKNRI